MKEKWFRGSLYLCTVAALSLYQANTQPISSLSVSLAGGPFHSGDSVAIVVRALGTNGFQATNWQGQARLAVFQPSEPAPVISEVSGSPAALIELTNPGDEPIDLSNWEVEALRDYSGSVDNPVAPNARLRIPQSTWLPSKGVMTWTDQGVAPGVFPAFVSAKRLSANYGFFVARLLNPQGETVDEVYYGSLSAAPGYAFWKGPGLGSRASSISLQRVGSANHRRNSDWVADAPTWGRLNPGLQVPWTNFGTWTACLPASIQLTNGIWSGLINLPNLGVGRASLVADNGTGISGMSPAFDVTANPQIALEIPPNVSTASEAHAGFAGMVTISVPSPPVRDLPITLTLSDTNEFDAPSVVTIRAGEQSVQAPITNLDDGLADGAAVVTLTAAATGYSSASATLVNLDDESGALYVIVPASVREDSGFGVDLGRVFLAEPAHHDVLIALTADDPVEVPNSIIIPKGRLSQSFPLRIGNDSLVNPVPWQAHVRARTSTWPWADAVIFVADDDDPSFSLNLPDQIVEGTHVAGQIQVKTPRQLDTTFKLSSDSVRLTVPNEVVLPAGALSVDFALEVPDNSSFDFGVRATVWAETGGQGQSGWIFVLDDEVDLYALVLGWVPGAVFSGQPIALSAALVDAANQPQVTNVLGHLDLLVSSNLAHLRSEANPMQFTNGAWAGSLVADGEALGCQLKARAAGFEAVSPRFDVLQGLDVPFDVLDAAWSDITGKLLVTEPARTNAFARLTELDPFTGTPGRTIELPRTAQRVVVSDDGRVAWLASDAATLQRIDLVNWRFDREFALDPENTNALILELVVLPAQPERLIAVTKTEGADWQAVLFDHGVLSANRASVPGLGVSTALATGRDGEVFCQTFGKLSRLVISSNAVTLDRSVWISSSALEVPSLVFTGDAVVRGTGEAFDPDNLEVMQPFRADTSLLGISVPSHNKLVFLEHYNVLRSYDLVSRELVGAHALPDSTVYASRLIHWGVRGLAALSASSKTLTVFQTPLLSTTLPDLVLTAHGPSSLVLSNCNLLATNSWEFCITNRGSSSAQGVELRLDSGGVYPLGSLAPGEGTSVEVAFGSGTPAVVSAHGTAVCASGDANPADNSATVTTRVRFQDLPSSGQLILGTTHLIGSPSGDRLFASVTTGAGDVEDGVAVINPETGTILQMLPIGPDPERLAITPDGRNLYVLLGTNVLTRWNLVDNTNDLSIRFTNETVLDFVSSPDSSRSVVVATTQRVAVFDDDQMRPGSFLGSTGQRFLGYAAGKLWAAEPGHLRYFSLSGSGLSAPVDVQFSTQSGSYRFVSDGRQLFFSGGIFDAQTFHASGEWLGYLFCADTSRDSLFAVIGGTVRRYSLSNHQLQAEQGPVQTCGTAIQDIVRWGEGGLAVRAGQQLLMVRPAVVSSPETVDLQVNVIAPETTFPMEPMEWTIVLTNKSDYPAKRTLLSADWSALWDIQVEGSSSWQGGWSMLYDAGDFPGHASATMKVRGWSFGGYFTMNASVQTAARDLNPTDNSVSVTRDVEYSAGDLAVVSITALTQVRLGEPFDVSLVVSNAGPAAVNLAWLDLGSSQGLQILAVSTNAFTTNSAGRLTGTLASHELKTVVLTCEALDPGALTVTASIGGAVSDSQTDNNQGTAWVFAAPPSTNEVVTRTFPSIPIMVWDRSRQEVLAGFPEVSALFVLDPLNLQPTSVVPLPAPPALIAGCNNGRHAWVSAVGGTALRVDLIARSVDFRFDYAPIQSSAYLLAVPPGQSNTILTAFIGSDLVEVFDDGVKRPIGYGPLPWSGGGASLVFAPDGRLFASSSQMLRELQLTPSGAAEVQNLDSAAIFGDSHFTYADNRLFFWQGRRVDLTNGTVDDSFVNQYPLVADDETGFAYTAYGNEVRLGGWPASLSCMDASTLGSRWRLPLATGVSGMLPMGTNGCVVIGDGVWLVRAGHLQSQAADLDLTLTVPSGAVEISAPFPVQVAITNKSIWSAQQAVLSLSLAPGLVFAPGDAASGETNLSVGLGSIVLPTNLTFMVVATTNGSFGLRASVGNSLPDSDPGNDKREAVVNVAPPPVFLFDDTTVLENAATRSGMLIGWLSRPAPTNMSVSFSLTPLTAQSNDFALITGTFQFSPGQNKVALGVIKGDNVPELDETATLTFSSTDAILARAVALLTIANDDRPLVSVTNVTVLEGDVGFTNADFKVSLSVTNPFPVDVLFQVSPVTALPGLDYLPRQGWLHFEPGEKSKTVSVPVLGDALFEPDETASFVLLEAINADFGSSQSTLTIKNDDFPSAPSITIIPTGGGLSVGFDSLVGLSYRLQSRTNLTDDTWHTQPSALSGNGARLSFDVPPPTDTSGFFRVTAE